MHRSSLTEHGLLIAAAAFACLAVTPTALGQDVPPAASDPAAAAVALADAALAGMPPLDAAAIAAQVTLPTTPPATPVAAPEAVPAAAAEPNPAMEPHPSPPPPPPQPEANAPLEVEAELAPISAEEIAPFAPSAAVEPVEAPQYQPAPPQYQPPAAVTPQADPAATSSAVAPPEQESSWDWTWSCGGAKPAAQPPATSGEGLPENWNWNWDWNCGSRTTPFQNKKAESGTQYQPVNTRYQPVNVNISIRIGSPGDDGAVAQTNVVLAVEAGPAAATVAASAPAPASAPQEPSAAVPAAPAAAPAAVEKPKQAKTKLASPTGETRGFLSAQPVAAEAPLWTARPVVSGRLQPNHPEADRSRPQLRRPTRRPLPPRRAPAIPVGTAGASPLGGSDGGGFQIALLLVPFVLALVDSVRRSVRDITPPVGRAFRARQERPG